MTLCGCPLSGLCTLCTYFSSCCRSIYDKYGIEDCAVGACDRQGAIIAPQKESFELAEQANRYIEALG